MKRLEDGEFIKDSVENRFGQVSLEDMANYFNTKTAADDADTMEKFYAMFESMYDELEQFFMSHKECMILHTIQFDISLRSAKEVIFNKRLGLTDEAVDEIEQLIEQFGKEANEQ